MCDVEDFSFDGDEDPVVVSAIIFLQLFEGDVELLFEPLEVFVLLVGAVGPPDDHGGDQDQGWKHFVE